MLSLRADETYDPVVSHMPPEGSPADFRVEVVPDRACAEAHCGCFGRGEVLLVGGVPGTMQQMKVFAATLMAKPCGPRMQPGKELSRAASGTRVFYGEAVLAELFIDAGQFCQATVPFQLLSLKRRLLRIAGDTACDVLLWHRPPRLSFVERSLTDLLPRSNESASFDDPLAGYNPHPAARLVVHREGWALGGFLARAALQRRQAAWHPGSGEPGSRDDEAAAHETPATPGVFAWRRLWKRGRK